MKNLKDAIYRNALSILGDTKLTWMGVLKAIKNSHPDIKVVTGTRHALTYDNTTIYIKTRGGVTFTVKLHKVDSPSYRFEHANPDRQAIL